MRAYLCHIITWNIPTFISYCCPKGIEIGAKIAPRATSLFVCTKPLQVRSKQPVDLYVSFCTTIKKSKINVISLRVCGYKKIYKI